MMSHPPPLFTLTIALGSEWAESMHGSLFFVVFTTSDFCGRTRLTDRDRADGAKATSETARLLGV
jgi:hypothetical protein